jgi:6,7-dimethyl-8-ribityllumazine synthase
MKILEGKLDASGLRIAMAVSRFNDLITSRLAEGALDCFVRHGGSEGSLTLAKVPGAFELPMIVGKLAGSRNYDAIVALGAVIRGSTPHFEYVSAEATKGIAAESLKTGIPISFGVLTCDTLEQALERAGTKAGNKGWDAMLVAIEMANLASSLANA